MDKLIKYTNERQSDYQINAFYSTPSCYLKALHDANIDWPTKTDDFFPLGNDPHTYWTGYYTSRPTSERFERIGNQFLQICKKLSATATTPEGHYDENLMRLKSQMGVMQHHDAITGTEKQHVADDYHFELYRSIIGCEENTKSSLNQLFTGMAPSASVFIGDSLIEWFKRDGLKYWTQHFAESFNCINLGVAGITTQETIHRLTKGQVLERDPNLLPSNVRKVCPLLIGTNDIGMRYDEHYISDHIKQIIEILQEKLVHPKILLIGILPRGSLPEKPAAVNQIISKYENGDSIRYLDLTDKFCSIDQKTGKISLYKKLYWSDQLHLSCEGYKVWTEAMLPLFKEMIDK